jgi:FKBP-type peptidyl-prolyl cis-trans isomerase
MKRIFCGALVLFGIAVFYATAESENGGEKAELSYAFGMAVAADIFLESGFEIDYDAFIQGFRNIMEGRETRHTMEQAMDIIQVAYITAQAAMLEQNLIEGLAFLAENAQRPGVVTTTSGLQYEVIVEGAGERPESGDVVLVHYRGTTIDGVVFDSTFDRGMPVEIPLDIVIPGWSEGLRLMREGGRAILYIPPSLAYGERGAGGIIAPNSTLIFEVELIAIVRSEQ